MPRNQPVSDQRASMRGMRKDGMLEGTGSDIDTLRGHLFVTTAKYEAEIARLRGALAEIRDSDIPEAGWRIARETLAAPTRLSDASDEGGR